MSAEIKMEVALKSESFINNSRPKDHFLFFLADIFPLYSVVLERLSEAEILKWTEKLQIQPIGDSSNSEDQAIKPSKVQKILANKSVKVGSKHNIFFMARFLVFSLMYNFKSCKYLNYS